jgi:hypothetical protein
LVSAVINLVLSPPSDFLVLGGPRGSTQCAVLTRDRLGP